MTQHTLGFIGFGEASYLISEGLASEGFKDIYAYDVLSDHPDFGQKIQDRANQLGVNLVNNLEALAEKATILISATSAKVAKSVAEDAQPFLNAQHFYVDINAASPMIKEEIADIIKPSKAQFVDGAVMESVPVKKHKTPIYLSGNGAHDFETIGRAIGFNLTYINEKPGSSSAIKMFRSIFMKGFTMLLWETLESSHKYGVTDLVLASLNQTIANKTVEDLANVLVTRTAPHAERRVSEMSEVVKTLDSLEIDSTLSKAIKEKLQHIVDLNLKDTFKDQSPESYTDILDVLSSINS